MSRPKSNTSSWSTYWTGPEDHELEEDGTTLKHPVPGERWPFGPRVAHEDCCHLHTGGLYCDCKASDASAED